MSLQRYTLHPFPDPVFPRSIVPRRDGAGSLWAVAETANGQGTVIYRETPDSWERIEVLGEDGWYCSSAEIVDGYLAVTITNEAETVSQVVIPGAWVRV